MPDGHEDDVMNEEEDNDQDQDHDDDEDSLDDSDVHDDDHGDVMDDDVDVWPCGEDQDQEQEQNRPGGNQSRSLIPRVSAGTGCPGEENASIFLPRGVQEPEQDQDHDADEEDRDGVDVDDDAHDDVMDAGSDEEGHQDQDQ